MSLEKKNPTAEETTAFQLRVKTNGSGSSKGEGMVSNPDIVQMLPEMLPKSGFEAVEFKGKASTCASVDILGILPLAPILEGMVKKANAKDTAQCVLVLLMLDM